MGFQSPFNTENADGGKYESLEERVFLSEIDEDNKDHKPVRLRSWQRSAVDYIKREVGANQVKIGYFLYLEGAKVLRDRVGYERIKDYGRLLQRTIELFSMPCQSDCDRMDYFDVMVDNEIKDPNRGMGQVGDPFNVYVPSSVLSEVIDTYEVDAHFGPWIHRAVLSLGLTQSETLPQSFIDTADDVACSINSSYTNAVNNAEQNIISYISDNAGHWRSEGIPPDKADKLGEVIPLLSETRETMARSVVDGLEVQTND